MQTKKVKPGSHDLLTAAGACPGFCSMKRLEVFLLPPGRDASRSQVTSPAIFRFPNNSPVLIYTPGWREALNELTVLPKNTTQRPLRNP